MQDAEAAWGAFCCEHRAVSRRLRLVHLRTVVGQWLLRSFATSGCVLAPLVILPPPEN